MPKSLNKWKKAAGCSISTVSPPICAEINFSWCCVKITQAASCTEKGTVLKAEGQVPRAAERFRGNKITYFYEPTRGKKRKTQGM